MLEYRLEPEGGLLVCALGTLEVGGGQIVECSLCLSDILPERRVPWRWSFWRANSSGARGSIPCRPTMRTAPPTCG